MSKKYAVKRLTASDLTFFVWQFKHKNAGNQKAINLNTDIFIQDLYPTLPEIALSREGKLPIDLFIYGPGLESGYNIQRKIVKLGTYKNWRLDGEFVYNPEDNPTRFNSLAPGDFVIFEFSGDVNYPTSVKAVFISSSIPEDLALHKAIDTCLGDKKMSTLTPPLLNDFIETSQPLDSHPINELILEEALQDVALGDIEQTRRLLSRPSGRYISQGELHKARQNADAIGRIGEEFVNAYLSKLKIDGHIVDFKWVSEENAISPYDFQVSINNNEIVFIDAKTTKGSFNRNIHISMNELRQMGTGPERYDLFRVFEIDESSVKLRIAEDMRTFAVEIVSIFESLPTGVTPDSVSVSPTILPFQNEISIQIPNDEDE